MRPLLLAYLEAARSAADLVGSRLVAERWDEPSALPGMSVGALAAHLGSQLVLVRDTVRDTASWAEEAPVPLLDHYRRSAWVTAGPEDEANVTIRESADELAGPGSETVVAEVRRAWEDLQTVVEDTTLPAVVRMPWWGWALTFEDFLVTRMMEITVHSDDLAVSLDVEPPEQPAVVLEPVLSLLTGVAVLRHGQAAVVRALTRAERAPASITAF